MKTNHRLSLKAAICLLGFSAATAASADCLTMDECFRSASRAALNSIVVETGTEVANGLCPKGEPCLVDRRTGVDDPMRVGTPGIAQASGPDALLSQEVAFTMGGSDLDRARDFTAVLRLRQPSVAAGDIHASGGLIALFPGATALNEPALEIFVDVEGRLGISRVNNFAPATGTPVRYAFDLWEPTAPRSADDYITVVVRLSGDGKFRLDTFTAATDAAGTRHVRWDQGKQEIDYPQITNTYPMGTTDRGGERPQVNAYQPFYFLSMGPGQRGRSYGAFNRLATFEKALSDKELIAVIDHSFGPAQPLSLDLAPCNSGRYLNFEGAVTRTPCGDRDALLPKEILAPGAYTIATADGRGLRRDGNTIVLDPPALAGANPPAPERWQVNSSNYNQVFLGIPRPPANPAGQNPAPIAAPSLPGAVQVQDGLVQIGGSGPVGSTNGSAAQAWIARNAGPAEAQGVSLTSLSDGKGLCLAQPQTVNASPTLRLCGDDEPSMALTFTRLP